MAPGIPPTEQDQATRVAVPQVAAFVDLVIAEAMPAVDAIVARLIPRPGGRQAVLDRLLLPAARRLGVMWERDECDFLDVTLAVHRLEQIMRETAITGDAVGACEHRCLILPAPGEQHGFGAGMVSDVFFEAGWNVHAGPALGRGDLLQLVRDEWFDVIGLSVTAERWLRGLPACLRALRAASLNQAVFIMVGGHAVGADAERARFLGADATADSAAAALVLATSHMEAVSGAARPAAAAQRVDAG